MTDPSPLLERWDAVTALGERVLIEDDHEAVSAAELRKRATAIARLLARQGLGGARIALLAAQRSSWVEGFFGVLLAGGAVVPLSPLHPAPERRYFVEASGAAALLVDGEHRDGAEGFALGRPVIEIGAAFGPEVSPGGDTEQRETPSPGSLAMILYTSGTTGRPKGALITHANLAGLAELLREAWGFSDDDCLLHTLPLHHLHGIAISLLVSLLAGAKTRMVDRFEAARVWELLGTATVLMGVPTQHRRLFDALDALKPQDAESAGTRQRWEQHGRRLRLVTSGSAALPVGLGERWRTLAGQYPLERYGMTEVGIALSNPLDGERRPGSCGQVLSGMQVRIVDEGGSDVPPGASGEIWIAGPSVFAGYDGDAQATAAAFTDGWFRSGDTATWLEAGYVKILGRTSVDIIKSGGYKLSALEMEEVLREHEAVADVAVVGLADSVWGERAVAAIVVAQDAADPPTSEALRRWAKQRVAAYKVPREVVIVDDLPRNALGKVTKPELARRLASARESQPG